MKRLLLFAMLTLAFWTLIVTPSSAAISTWVKGVSILPATNTDLGSDQLKRSLDKLKEAGANYVSFNIPYYQADTNSTTMARGGNTPTDEALSTAVMYAHSIGLKVSLKINVETYDQGWRAYINPDDRTAWFTSYGNLLKYYGAFATAYNVEMMVIGTELIKMASDRENPTNTQNWKKMIDDLKTVYKGKLTYGANWGDGGGFAEEVNQIKFWDKLDYIGISAYYWLAPQSSGVASVDDLKASWEDWDIRKIEPITTQWNKPVLFTEVGYRSFEGSHREPWSWWSNAAYSAQEQVNDYTALFSYWNQKNYMQGVLLWAWEVDPNAGGNGNLGYTPQNKPAEQTMREWFKAPPSPEPSNPTFAVTRTIATAAAGSSVPISITVKNTSTQSIDALVDIELFDASYLKIHQEFFGSQYFNAGETKTFTTTWTARSEGTYPLMVGVFKNDWSVNYLWEDNAGTVTVTGTTKEETAEEENSDDGPPPPPSPSTLDIWWPSSGASVSGLQPFKALLTDRSLDQYEMYWQVDGGQLNPMDNSDVDWPHKEAWVDLTGWNWKGTGPYSISFIAKELSGLLLGSKSIDITITQ